MCKRLFLLLLFLIPIASLNAQIETFDALSERFDVERLPKSSNQAGPVFSGDLFEVLDQTFDSITALSPIYGFNAALLAPDGTLWTRARGISQSLPLGASLSTEHLMGMGSITKSFLAATLLLLMEEGYLNLDDSIGMYLDPYPNVPPEATIRQLLSHRTGIMDFLNDDQTWLSDWLAYPDSIWVTDSVLHHYVLEPKFPLGTEWGYSNTNYLLAQRIIEEITAQPWYEVVRARILDPLELSHTFAYPFELPDIHQPFSHCWANLGNGNGFTDVQGSGVSLKGFYSMMSGVGCFITTPADLVHFNERLHGGYLLQPGSLAEMHTDYLGNPTGILANYGLAAFSYNNALSIFNTPNWGHAGSAIYQSLAFYFPEENISLAVQQNDPRSGNSITDFNEVFLALLHAYLNYAPTTSIAAHGSKYHLNVYPNPTGGRITIEIPDQDNLHAPLPCSLTSVSGHLVRSFDLYTGSTTVSLDDVPDGLYMLRVAGSVTKVLVH